MLQDRIFFALSADVDVPRERDVQLCLLFLSSNPDMNLQITEIYQTLRSSLLQMKNPPQHPFDSAELANQAISFFAFHNVFISNEQILNYPTAANELFAAAKRDCSLPLIVFDKPNSNGYFTVRNSVLKWMAEYCGYQREGLSMLIETQKCVRNILERLRRFPYYNQFYQNEYKYIVKCISVANGCISIHIPMIDAFKIHQQS
jgi:hypothetical protein